MPNNVENPPSSSLACTSTARSAGARQLPLIAPLLLRPVVTAVLAATDWEGWAPPAKYQPSSTRHTRLPHTLAGPALEFPASQLRESRHSLRGQPTQQFKWNKGFLFCFNNGFFSRERTESPCKNHNDTQFDPWMKSTPSALSLFSCTSYSKQEKEYTGNLQNLWQ